MIGGPAQPDGLPDTAWVVAGRGESLLVGPARALADHPDRRSVVSIDPSLADAPLGEAVAEHPVAESGLRSFTVSWYAAAQGRTTAVNPAGGNRVSWDPARCDVRLTPAKDAHLTSVHVRFVLRHLTTALLAADAGGRAIHAVTGRPTGGAGGVLAVAGPTTSGKTRLVNQLVVAGLLGEVVDDDCPVLAPGGALLTLVPRRYEVACAVRTPLRTLVLLSDGCTRPREIDQGRARAFLESTPVPWPAPWLPADERLPAPELPAGLRVVELPARDPGAYRFLLAGSS